VRPRWHLSDRLTSTLVAIPLISLALSLGAVAQVQNGVITGTVSDASEAVLAGATVTVKNIATGLEIRMETNEAGLYSARELNIGPYRVRVAASGFKTAEAADLVLNAGTVLRVDFKLQVGAPTEAVEVTGAAAPINTENARLSTTVDSTQIANLPLNGRNVYDLIQYAPGATNVRGVIFENGANTVVNGVRENFNGFLINGVSNKALSGGAVNQPIQDTVAEFQLVTLNNSAEFGNSAGAITNLVTKSGTNAWHGSLWEYFRNDALDANPFFANHFPLPSDRQKTPLRLNQFGGTVGGPIKKDKIFLFAAYQGDRFVTSNPFQLLAESPQFRSASISAFPNTISSLLYSDFAPTTSGTEFSSLSDYVANGFSGSSFTSFASYLCPAFTDGSGALAGKFATLFGVEQADIDQMNQSPDEGGCPGGSPFGSPRQGTFNRHDPFLMTVLNQGHSQTQENLFNGNEASFRLDYNPSQNNRLFAQFNWSRASDRFTGDGNSLRGFSNPSLTTTPNFQFSYVHLFSATLLNEFRAGYAENGNVIGVGLPGVPSITFDDGTLGFGSYNGYPQSFHENIYTYSDMVSLSHGKHNVKAGGEVRRNLENSDWNVGRPSYFFYDPLFFAVDAPYREAAGIDPGFISGKPAQLSTNIRHWRNWELGFYGQDDWKISKRLTLNMGLRYDLYTRHTELSNLATTFLKGPGQNLIDDITTGAGQIKSASTPCPGNPLATLAGACGPGGFAPTKSLGKGDHNDFGPRLGFAWDVLGNGKTSLRGGFGISYEGTLYNPLSNTRWNPPYFSADKITGPLGAVSGATPTGNVVYGPVGGGSPTYLGPAPPAQHAGSGVQATGNIGGWDPTNPHLELLTSIVFPEGIRDPYVENWFLGVQREIRSGLVVEINYVGTAGHKLFRSEQVNRVAGGRLPEGACLTDNFGRKVCSQIDSTLVNGLEKNPEGTLNPNFGVLRVWRNVNNSIYNGLQFSVKERMGDSLAISGNYTYSHALDNGSGWHSGATTANGGASGDAASTDFTLPGLDRGNATFDIRHRLTFNHVWQLPWLRYGHGITAMALGGWQLNGIWTFQSGAHWTPFSSRPARLRALAKGACDAPTLDPVKCVNTGGDYNLDGISNDRPNGIANHVNASHAQWADGFQLPDGFFSAPCLGCVSNLGRNTFVGPGYWAADVSMFKSFRLRERFALQFRVEAFNVFNHTNFELGPNAHNRITDPLFGQAAGTGPPRNLQLALKLSF
jgi:outer membrane receptor protein involved in Fe transport